MSLKDGGEKKDLLRITNQFRQNKSMIYDLRGDGFRLVLSIRGRDSESEPDDFCVEARSSTGMDATVLSEWGSTKANALSAVGRSWTDRPDLAPFDWEAIARVLTTVRAV
jgi:hypothetical protein